MDENNLDNQNQPQQPEQDNVSKLDKIIQNNPFVNMGQARYENVQTQSVVMSTREEAGIQLAQIEAQNAEILRQQKLAEDARRAKKTGVYIIVAFIFIAIIVAGGWLIFNAVLAGQQTVTPEEIGGDDDGGEAKYGRVEGYKCTSDQCEKAADIDDNKIIVRDSNKFYIYNKNSKRTSLTTIASKVYHEIAIFSWNNKTLAVLDPESGQSALYDITSNRQVTSFLYDEFYTDPSADVYKDLANELSSYIIARNGTSYRLVDLSSGTEKVRSDKRVFAHGVYFFSYEVGGTIRAYTDTQKQIAIVAADETVFIKDNYLIVMKPNGTFAAYDSNGVKNTNYSIVKTINKIQSKTRLNTLMSDSSYYRLPANN